MTERTTFTRAELEAFVGSTVDDLLGIPARDPVKLLFVGINPGLWTAAVNAHFARRGNRFWPALHRASITSEPVDASGGMPGWAREELVAKGVGITNLVPVATARADELSADQLREGGERLRRLVADVRPKVVAILGLTAFRVAFGVRQAPLGRSAQVFEGADLWLLPNPSGLNAHHTVDSLADWYGRAAAAAGVLRTPPHAEFHRAAGRAPSRRQSPTEEAAMSGGEFDQAKGRVKQAAGELTDDEDLEREGEIDEMAGKLKDKADDAKDKVEDAIDAVRDKANDDH